MNKDGITVNLITPSKTVSASALIRWNIGEILWMESTLPVSGEGEIRVVDPDMNLDPEQIEEFKIKVWSTTDPAGIKSTVNETGKNTGIFKGIVKFTTEGLSKTPVLRVSEGDIVTAEYVDKTLPEPYSANSEFTITATTMIGTLHPPTELNIVVDGDESEKNDTIMDIKNEEIQQRFPLKPIVSIPSGSSVPGCEECDKCFIPSKIVIRVNQTVFWTNDDSAAHTVTSGTPDDGPDGELNSSFIMAGNSFAYKFTKKGMYRYFCMVHPWQQGIIIVE
jgi:plastocyanin